MDVFDGPLTLPPRDAAAHKANVGRVLVVGGSLGMSGAPALAALGALRAGAGLVNVAVPSAVQPAVASYRPEWMTTALGAPDARALDADAERTVASMAPDWDAVVLGPGLGRGEALAPAHRLAESLAVPVILDADGLFGWTNVDVLANRNALTVLTPHEGEAARLLETTSAQVRQDREAAVETLVRRTGGMVVLKGPHTLVCDGKRLFRNETGNPVLATGGTGDVLAGVCAALVAQALRAGGDPFLAVCAAVHVHGLVGDRLASVRDRGVLASEVADGIPDAIATLVGGST